MTLENWKIGSIFATSSANEFLFLSLESTDHNAILESLDASRRVRETEAGMAERGGEERG